MIFFFFFKYTATTEIYTYLHTLSLHDALPISPFQRTYLTEFCSTAKFLYSTFRLLTATILCNMANSERLRLNKNQHVVKNLLSKGDDKKVVEAMMHVIEYMTTRFPLKDMGYRLDYVDRITLRELHDRISKMGKAHV